MRGKQVRLRNIPRAKQVIEASPTVIQNPESCLGRWHDIFGNQNPIQIEIGMGKGRFLTELAKKNPDINYIGIEKYTSVLLRAVEKLGEETLPNLYFICMFAENLEKVFAKEELDRVYLNFSDPWPKDRHQKRRLTSRNYLSLYEKILKKDGLLEFKTDNLALFDFSLAEIPAAGWKLLAQTKDLHHDPLGARNIMTEYEERFSEKGNPICKLIAQKG
ncbi:MAG: tRNA (guanosine(46)-N7)-methyltransferase TrmB [Lachnospiraceae bacterium]|nr:tRNA (guanosine(46)-N7)-methyltransferase TrmB [Lachnospiraceae bacterium]